MDPQQRLLLEVTYEALENAGIRMEELVGSKTSCYVGDFSSRDFEINMNKDTENIAMQQLSGNTMSIMSNRLSYFFGLQGPSLTVDTACSSGLVALHLACQSIKSGESKMAIVAGVNLMLSPDMTMALDALHLLSPDGKSYAFDSRANGYGRGEGFAVVILKPKIAAIRNNDRIRAIVRGTGCNHDGKTRGLHLPSAEAQEALIRETYATAGLDLKDTGYCEAHGTGTAVGDPLEAKALAATFGKARESSFPLLIGSVKTNIGHLEGAAGLVAVIKTVLALERGIIPPSVNFETPTARIPFANNNLEVVTEPKGWPAGVRRASINSFGFGGTNSHAILEGAHQSQKLPNGSAEYKLPNGIRSLQMRSDIVLTNGVHETSIPKQPKLLCWSAHDEKGIERLCEKYADYLSSKTPVKAANCISADDYNNLFDDLWYTLSQRRSSLAWKSWCLASTVDELHQKLKSGISRPVRSSKAPQIAFVFTGQGAQWYAMGRQLWTYEVYRKSVQQAESCLALAGCSWSVIEELNRNADSSKLNEAIYSQPLCTVLQVALVELLRSWGIQPRAVVGHSSGEIAAAYCVGALSAESAWKLAYHRGQLSKVLKAGSGAMMSVSFGEKEANKYIDGIAKGKATVACINSPSSVTLSGDVCVLHQLERNLKSDGIFARKLKVEVAYHSHHMKSVANNYLEAIKDIETVSSSAYPEIKMFSSVTGEIIDPSALTPDYWVRNLVSPVRFSDAVRSLSTFHPAKRRRRVINEKFVDLWIEVGPHGALATPVKQTLDDDSTEYLTVLQRGKDAIGTALAVAGGLWARDYPVDLVSTCNSNRATARQPSLLVDTPQYSWKHDVTYWFEPRLSTAHRFRQHPRQDLLGGPVEGSSEPAWRQFLRMSENPWMEDHQIRLNILYCSAGLMTMAVQGAKQLAQDTALQVSGYELRDVHLHQSLRIPPEEEGVELMMKFRAPTPEKSESADSELIIHTFVIDSLDPGQKDWQRICSGKIVTHVDAGQASIPQSNQEYTTRYEDITASCKHETKAENFYLELAQVGIAIGATFRNLTRISSSNEQSSCNIRVPNVAATMPENFEYPHLIHPALLESLTHMMIPALTGTKTPLKETLVPVFFGSVYISNDMTIKPGDELQGYAIARWHNHNLAEGSIVALDPRKTQPLVIITEMQCQALPTWDVGANEWQPVSETSTKYRKLCSQMDWKIDPESFRTNESVDLRQYFDCLFHKTPSLKILQLGGNPASVSVALLQVATSDGAHLPRFYSLLYTADSARAIADAGIVLAEWSAHLQYEMLNVEEDLAEQNIEPGTYDLVIADATAETPERMSRFLAQIEDVLKPNGTLVLEVDATKLGSTASASCGLANSSRETFAVQPLVVESWKRTLMELGFNNGPLLDKGTTGPDERRTQMMVATNAAASSSASHDRGEILIVQPAKAGQEVAALMIKIVERLSVLGFKTAIVDLCTAHKHALESLLVVNLAEITESLLSNIDFTAFEAIKDLVLRSRSLLWVTMGGTMTGESPAMSVTSGFGRTVRYETDSPNFATLDLGSASQLNQMATHDSYAEAIGRVVLLLSEEDAAASFEREFAYHEGHLYVPRVSPLKDMNDWMNSPQEHLKSEKVRLGQIECPIQIAWETEGDIDELHFKEDSKALAAIADNEVRIDVKVSALNMADLTASANSMGLECAGVITDLGRNVRHLRKGDRVAAIGPGCHRTAVRASGDLCQRIPESLSFEQGASIPFAYCTAYLGLIRTASLKPGETVLIHGGPDGINQAAVQLALHVGAEPFIITQSLESQTIMIDQQIVPEDHILAFDSFEFPRTIMRLTNDKGINVVFGSSLGEIMRQSWHCIAKFGRYINLHVGSERRNPTELDMRPFERSAAFSSIDIIALLEHDPAEVAEIFQQVRCLLDEGSITPISPIATFNYNRIAEGFATLRSASCPGKLAFSAQKGDLVPVARAASKPFTVNPEASYVLAGGLGGLGRSVAQWLISHGARSLIFLSRTGAQNSDITSFVTDLRAQGINIGVYKCDISDPHHLSETIEECTSTHPPIRGVIQCAMNLQDSAFENMTTERWQAALLPKVQGSWNLHASLPQDMDFFIMLASFVGITGNRGQSNYAGANAYQDALALHRRARNLPATSIDLGYMHGIGVVADKWAQTSKLRSSGFEGMKEQELHILLEAAITGRVRGVQGTSVPSQIITGVSTGGMIERSGAMDLAWMKDAKFSYLKTVDSRQTKETRTSGSEASQLKRRLREASTKIDSTAVVEEALIAKLVQSTGLDIRELNENKPIHALGLDSLVAIELRGWAKRELKAEISGVDILSNVPIRDVAAKMAEASGLVDISVWG